MALGLLVVLLDLKRRKVGRVAVVYALAGLGLIEAADLILGPLQLSGLYPAVVILTLLGFPIALVLAGMFTENFKQFAGDTSKAVREAGPLAEQRAGAWLGAEDRFPVRGSFHSWKPGSRDIYPFPHPEGLRTQQTCVMSGQLSGPLYSWCLLVSYSRPIQRPRTPYGHVQPDPSDAGRQFWATHRQNTRTGAYPQLCNPKFSSQWT